MVATKPYDRILAVATRLFYEDGIRVTGVDRIIAEAKVAPMTLYRHFGSKDKLVATTLERWSAQWLQWLSGGIDQCSDDPQVRLVALWDMLEAWTTAEDFRGSYIVSAAMELRSDVDHPAQEIIASHRRAVRQLLEDLARVAGAHDPVSLAAKLQILFDGAITHAVGEDPSTINESIRAFASAAISAHSAQEGAVPTVAAR